MKACRIEDWQDSNKETPLEFCIDVTEHEFYDGTGNKAREELDCLRENIIADREKIAYLRRALDAANEKLLYVCGESAPYYSEETGREFLKLWYECKLEEIKGEAK